MNPLKRDRDEVASVMHQPGILDQMITSVYTLHPRNKRKSIKEADVRIHPLDLLELTEHLACLRYPVAFDVINGKAAEDFTVAFTFDKIAWTCHPDVTIPTGAPLIILQT